MFAPFAHSETIETSASAPSIAETKDADPAISADSGIVVTATRRGEAEVAAESEFGEEEISSRGEDNIRDLLDRLSPFIGGNGEEPVILINGKPAGYDQSILYYPAEALERLAVLKPEAAAHYGEPAGKPVVNLVLKKNYSMLNADAGFTFATSGGQRGGTLSVGRAAISGDTRWNVQAQIGADSALLRSSRRLAARQGIFDSVGIVTSIDGAELDPALSAATGKRASFASIPSKALSRIPELADFSETSGLSHNVDPDRYETLLPSRRTASLNVGVTRPVGDFTVSLGLNADRNISEGLRGLPIAPVSIPSGNPWSPFAKDVDLVRPFEGERALRYRNTGTSFGANMTVNGKIAGWRSSLAINYSRNWASSLLENGIDIATVQQLVDAADLDFNPYGRWDESLLLANLSRTQAENFSARLNAQKSMLKLPAGPIVSSITASANQSRSNGWQRARSEEQYHATVRSPPQRQISGQIGISVPIARRGRALGWLGDLSAGFSASVEMMTANRAKRRFGGSLFWAPSPILDLRGSIDFAGASPSFEQLNGPIVNSIVRVFDYARQESAELLWITGGNQELRLGRRQSLTLASKLRPLNNEFLTLNVTYRQIVAKGGVSPFPELTPAIEAAFPDRISRDSEGRLVSVDARAVNLEKETNAELSTSLALRWEQKRAASQTDAQDPLQIALSVGHRWRMNSELRVRPGTPVIDQLRDSGQSRHNLIIDASVGKRGIGTSLSGNWSSPSRLRGAGENPNGFSFRPALNLTLSAFVEPERLFDGVRDSALLKGVKISIEIQNLLDGYNHVLLDDGSVPAGYSHDEIDPLGRAARLTIRKQF